MKKIIPAPKGFQKVLIMSFVLLACGKKDNPVLNPPPAAPTVIIYASPDTIFNVEKTMISWSSTNATSGSCGNVTWTSANF